MNAYRIAIDDVLALLHPEIVIAACGVDARERGRAWRLRTCPFCGAKPSRQGAAIYRRQRDDSWRATHHGHAGCAGDLLDMIAACERIDRKRELPRLLERAAQIAGMTPNDPDLEYKIAERVIADRQRRAKEDAERAAALAEMPAIWASLDRRSLVGERYLQGRGLDPAELRAQGDMVRYNGNAIAVAMRSFETGEVVGIQYRGTDAKRFHSAEWSDANNSALVGRLAELDPNGVDVAVVTEGLADSLAARLAFPSCAVFGAAGAGNLETVAEAVAARVREIGGWMLLTVDDDPAGINAAAEAIIAAQEAGLVLDRDLHLVEHGAHDLADAVQAGWRWQWPDGAA